MNNKDKDYYSIKFIIIGDTGVGKTQIIYRYTNGEFRNENMASTIGVDFSSKNIQISDKIFHLELWDTGGMESFKSIRQNYYKNAACAIIVYDITNKDTLKSVDKWIEECNFSSNNDNLIMILVGNKTDLIDKRQITEKTGKDYAKNNNMDFYESSALNGYNINEIFTNATRKIYNLITDGIEDKEYNGISEINRNTKMTIDENISLEINTGNDDIRDKHKSCCC